MTELKAGVTNIRLNDALHKYPVDNSKIYIHPQRDKKTFANDLAIVTVTRPFNLSSTTIQSICLGKH